MKLKNIGLVLWTIWWLGFTLPARGQVFTLQHNFTNTPDGNNPNQLVWTNGFFYGATVNGGANGQGMIYVINTNGSGFSPLYSFTGATNNGESPNNLLVASNVIYGTTGNGGTNGLGMIYAVNTNGTGFTPLYSFALEPDGYNPAAGLVLSGTTLYGTARVGGTNHGGTLFKINTNGTGYAILHWFTNTPDGSSPQSELVLSGGTLYGTTAYGGTNGYGTIFSITTNGTGYTILHGFTNAPDGSYPYGGLVLNSGILYGTTGGGGTNTTGTIYAINATGSGFTILHNFSANDGNLPTCRLMFSGGKLYGTAKAGGTGGQGTVFQINTNGSGFTVLRNFTNSPADGAEPQSGVILLGTSLWGTTYSGGAGYGTFYSLQLAPQIIQQPSYLTVNNGGAASFTNLTSGAAPLAYQWYFNTNTPVGGGTNAILLIASATTNQAGYYSVIVTNSYGSVTSSAAKLTVNTSTGSAPVITQQPQDLTVTNGNPASFTNAASGTGPLYYQWYFNTNTPVSGGTNAILLIASATTNQAGYYSVIVTNFYGSATSSVAQLKVIVPTSPPIITQQPQDLTVTNGNPASFTNLASGTGPLYYQWYYNTNTPVSGGTNAILRIASATTNQAGYYSVVVTNSAGSVTSSAAKLTIIIPVSPPVITQQPQNYTVTNGYSAAFTNVATGTGPLDYQWYYNTNTPVAGGTNSILLIDSVTTSQAGYYTVAVSNPAGSVTSAPALLAVISTPPIILLQPQPLNVISGDPVSFSVLAVGQSPLKYQWFTNAVSAPNALSGQTNSTLNYPAATTNLAANYLVYIYNALGKATSNPVLLTIITRPVITQQPQSVVVTNGNPVTFTAAATGAGLLSYQWYFRTNSLVAGATNTSLTFTNAITNLAGYYALRVTNTFGAVTSSFALLTISSQPNLLAFNFDPASGSPSFAFANLARSTNRLWASTNLISASYWTPVATNVMATNGLWFFTDTNAAKTNNLRFYRFSTP